MANSSSLLCRIFKSHAGLRAGSSVSARSRPPRPDEARFSWVVSFSRMLDLRSQHFAQLINIFLVRRSANMANIFGFCKTLKGIASVVRSAYSLPLINQLPASEISTDRFCWYSLEIHTLSLFLFVVAFSFA